MTPDFTIAAELVESLREAAHRHPAHSLYSEAAAFIERQADRINHLTNVNDGLRETIAELRVGLAELREMTQPEKSA